MEAILSHHIAFSIFAGFVLDCILGDPHCLPHPVKAMGSTISFLEKRLNKSSDSPRIQLLKGIILVLCLIFLSLFIPLLILALCRMVHPVLFVCAESIMCWQCIAARSLCSESMKVYRAVKKDDLEGARRAVSMIVGRDTDVLDMSGIIKAAVETVAENTSDGVVAPLFYMAFFGPIGGMVYKAINTMDSMIAYKNERYKNFGFCAAKLDDFANLIPSRLAAVLMIFASLLLSVFLSRRRFMPVNALKIFLRDRYKHASPNSAQTESVCAGALGIQLAGDTVYGGVVEKKDFIGNKIREIEGKDIVRSNILMYAATILSVFSAVLARLMLL